MASININNEKLIGMLSIGISLIIMLAIFVNKDVITNYDWKSLGYIGLFLVMLITSATVVLPVPGLAVATMVGTFTNPLLAGIAGGIGSAIGELVGYMAGYGGGRVINNENRKRYDELRKKLSEKNRGIILIFILSLIPNPLFDIAGMAAGAIRYPLLRFFIACALGKIIKVTFFAYIGYTLGGLI